MNNKEDFCPCCRGSLEPLHVDGLSIGTYFCLECGWEIGENIVAVEEFFNAMRLAGEVGSI